MTTFDERKEQFEKRFAHDAQLRFKAEARQAKLFGIWVAGKMGLEGEAAEHYAKDVVVSNLKEDGIDDILEKVMPDLERNQIAIPESVLRDRLDEAMQEAMTQVMTESGQTT